MSVIEVDFNRGNSMNPNYLCVGDIVSASPVGAGKVTGITDAGYPQVNHIAVTWLRRTDGVLYNPLHLSESEIERSME